MRSVIAALVFVYAWMAALDFDQSPPTYAKSKRVVKSSFLRLYFCGTADAADVAVRQQLSSLIFVKKICEAKIRTLKYGDGELPSLPSVRLFYGESILFVLVFRQKRSSHLGPRAKNGCNTVFVRCCILPVVLEVWRGLQFFPLFMSCASIWMFLRKFKRGYCRETSAELILSLYSQI